MKRLLHLLAIACMFALPLQAQRVLVSGKVMDAQTKESLQGANIYLRKLGKGVVSNARGNFQLSLSPKSKSGNERKLCRISDTKPPLEPHERYNTHYQVRTRQPFGGSRCICRPPAFRNRNFPNEYHRSAHRRSEKLPMLFSEVDVMKALQKLPGVQPANDGQAGIYVRGGGYDQNQITLDGATIYNAEHQKGFVSAINPDLVRSLLSIKDLSRHAMAVSFPAW